ncbi:3-methyladenine DNA glycosylase [Neomicrococcus lactis]|uniref:3-methyladenine DNA glycosylase n=1 Tax=Neomicrococcus lactis TaxID=732241 RepID=A0A7W8YC75_9MICC|nr:3-methyladenine DNA glycosylase [Neomicrococcus lactis]MBB5598570.1 hypothetical protein [Neomicrococcus lactis]
MRADTSLSFHEWKALERAHQDRVNTYVQPYLERRSHGKKHPVEDFLFTYYGHKPGQLLRWQPGAGVVLEDAVRTERASWKFNKRISENSSDLVIDVDGFLAERGATVDFVRHLVSTTRQRPANFACFGLHEWAMAYKSDVNGVRHEYLPLRLGASGTDTVVENHKIRCSHFDAFRFFTPQAGPLNELQPTRETQRDMEQPGCLHAAMDLYKWCYKLVPLISSDLIMDCFELAWDVRTVDMQASPYDLADWGCEPISIETPEGKARYVELQRGFAERSDQLRRRLLASLDLVAEIAARDSIRAQS